MEVLGQRSFNRVPQQHNELSFRQQAVDALRRLRMEQIKGCDVTAALLWRCARVVAGIPRRWLLPVLGEVVHLFARCQTNSWVLIQKLLQRGGSPFLGSQHQEIRQTLSHGGGQDSRTTSVGCQH